MEIAFYAPLKAPDHPVPSGDRRMAGLLMAALRAAGHDVMLASRLRSYEGQGDAVSQAEIRAAIAPEPRSNNGGHLHIPITMSRFATKKGKRNRMKLLGWGIGESGCGVRMLNKKQ